jgi:hypothetical protein
MERGICPIERWGREPPNLEHSLSSGLGAKDVWCPLVIGSEERLNVLSRGIEMFAAVRTRRHWDETLEAGLPVTARSRLPLARWLTISVIGVGVTFAARVLADVSTKQECVTANESAQSLRRNGKLRAARREFLRCTSKACPGPVRDDCEEQLSEVDRTIPSIVFVVTDDAGHNLEHVQVKVDGELLSDRLDGAAMAVDPGTHAFTFMIDGYIPDYRRVSLREGDKEHAERIRLARVVRGVRGDPRRPMVQGRGDPSSSGAGWPGSQTMWAYGIAATGGVAVVIGSYFGLHAKATYDESRSRANCPGGLSACNQSGVDGVNKAHTEAAVATVAFIAGAALLTGSIVLLLTAPKPDRARIDARVTRPTGSFPFGVAW